MQVEQILTVTHGSPVYGRGEDTSLLWSRAKGSVRNLQKLGAVSTPAEKAAIQKAGKGYPAFPPSLSQSLLHPGEALSWLLLTTEQALFCGLVLYHLIQQDSELCFINIPILQRGRLRLNEVQVLG